LMMSFMWNQPGQNCRFSTGQLPFLMKPEALFLYADIRAVPLRLSYSGRM